MICIKFLHLERFTGNETWQYLEKLCSVQKKKKKKRGELSLIFHQEKHPVKTCNMFIFEKQLLLVLVYLFSFQDKAAA